MPARTHTSLFDLAMQLHSSLYGLGWESTSSPTGSSGREDKSPPAATLSSQSVGENVRALPAPPRQRSITPSRGVPQRPLSLLPNDKEGPEQRVALLDASFSHGGEDAELPAWLE